MEEMVVSGSRTVHYLAMPRDSTAAPDRRRGGRAARVAKNEQAVETAVQPRRRIPTYELVDEDGLVGASLMGELLGKDVRQQGDGFDVAAFPAQVRRRDDGHPSLVQRRIWPVQLLHRHDHRGLGRAFRKFVVPWGRASRDLEIDESLIEAGALNPLLHDRGQSGHIKFDTDLVQTALQPLHVRSHRIRPSAVGRDHLVDAVGKLKAAVLDGDRRLVDGQERAVYIGNLGHPLAPRASQRAR